MSDAKLSRRGFLFGRFLKRSDDFVPDKPVAATDATRKALAEGEAAFERGDWQAALDPLRTFVRSEPGNAPARRKLGLALYRCGMHLQARVEFERLLRDLKKDNFASLYLGLAHCRMGKPDKAMEAWRGYFNPEALAVQREVNIQIALLEDPVAPIAPDQAAAAVEAAMEKAEGRKA